MIGRAILSVMLAIVAASSGGCALRRHPPAEAAAEPPAERSAPESQRATPTPTLLVDGGLSRDLILARLLRGRELLESLAERDLGAERRQQLEIAAGFLEEADEALGQEELERADVLSEKALALIEDVAGDG